MSAGELGSISTGTLRTEDLLEAFSDEVEHLIGYGIDATAEARELLQRGVNNWTEKDREAASWLVNETLPDLLQDCAPAFCYFGAHPGDGADFGFWVSDDAIQDAVHEGTILPVTDHRNADRQVIPEYVLHTNDHGNETLYGVQLTELWSIV